MDAEGLRKLRGCFLTVWNDSKRQAVSAANEDISPIHVVFGPTGTYKIGYTGIKAIRDALDVLGSSDLKNHYSQQYLNKEIELVILSLLDSLPQGIAKQVELVTEQWISRLESAKDTEWTVVAPIANLILEMDCLEVGDVTFYAAIPLLPFLLLTILT